jgi:hypothetical protein
MAVVMAARIVARLAGSLPVRLAETARYEPGRIRG